MRNDIYSLKLHENLYLEDHKVLRVPGGWVYTYLGGSYDSVSSCFVPFSPEFEPGFLDAAELPEEKAGC